MKLLLHKFLVIIFIISSSSFSHAMKGKTPSSKAPAKRTLDRKLQTEIINKKYNQNFGNKNLNASAIAAKNKIAGEIKSIAIGQKINNQPTNLQPSQMKKATSSSGLFIPKNTIVRHPEKMEVKKVNEYVAKFDTKLKSTYKRIPEDVLAQVGPVYIAESINVQSGGRRIGYNKVTPDNIHLQDWRVANPNRLQKISAGFNALNAKLGSNPNFYKKYDHKFQDKFMSAKANDYYLALKAKFPNVPQKVIQTYLTMFLEARPKEYRYQRRFGVPIPGTKDLSNPIKLSVSEINKAPGWNTRNVGELNNAHVIGAPTPKQKVYSLMEAMESIAAESKAARKIGPVSSWAESVRSTVNTAYAVGNAASTAYSYAKAAAPIAQAHLKQYQENPAEYGKFVRDTIVDRVTATPTPSNSTQKADPFLSEITNLSPQNKQAISRFGNIAARKMISQAENQVKSEAHQSVKAESNNKVMVIEPATQIAATRLLNTGVQAAANKTAHMAEQSLLPKAKNANPALLTPETGAVIASAKATVANAVAEHGLNIIQKQLEGVNKSKSAGHEKAQPSIFNEKVINQAAEAKAAGIKAANTAIQKKLLDLAEQIRAEPQQAQKNAQKAGKPYVHDKTHQAAGELFNAGVGRAADVFAFQAENFNIGRARAKSSKAASPYAFKPETKSKLNKAATSAAERFNKEAGLPEKNAQRAKVKNNIADTLGTPFQREITPAIMRKLGIPNNKNSAPQTGQKEMAPQRSTITYYIVKMFRSSGQKLAKTPEGMRSLVNNIVSKVSHVCGYPPKRTIKTQKIIDDALAEATNKDGFVHAKSKREYNTKFTAWTGRLITKICETFGRESPQHIQKVEILGKPNDPKSPTVSFVYNSATNTLKSGFVIYDGKTYKLKAEDLKYDPPTGEYTLITPLYNLATTPTMTRSQVVDPIIKNVTSSLRSPDPSTNKFLTAWAKYADAQLTGQGIDGHVKITFNKKNPGSLKQEITKTAPDYSTISTTVDWSTPNAQKKVKLAGDISTPSVNMALDARNNLQSVDISFNSIMENKISKPSSQKIAYDKATGLYTISALFEAPKEAKPTGLNAVKDTYNRIAAEVYPKAIKILAESYGVTSAKHSDPHIARAINESQRWLTEPVATSMQKVVVTYDPSMKTFTTAATKIMSSGPPVTTNLTYSMKQ